MENRNAKNYTSRSAKNSAKNESTNATSSTSKNSKSTGASNMKTGKQHRLSPRRTHTGKHAFNQSQSVKRLRPSEPLFPVPPVSAFVCIFRQCARFSQQSIPGNAVYSGFSTASGS